MSGLQNHGFSPNATHFGTAGAISCSGVAQATRFFMSFLAQHRTARAVPLPKSAALGSRPWLKHAAASRLVAILQNTISPAIQSYRSKKYMD